MECNRGFHFYFGYGNNRIPGMEPIIHFDLSATALTENEEQCNETITDYVGVVWAGAGNKLGLGDGGIGGF